MLNCARIRRLLKSRLKYSIWTKTPQPSLEADADLVAFKSGLRAYAKSRNTDKQAAYTQLAGLLSHYKNIETSNLNKETAQIEALLASLGQEPYKTSLKTLSLQAFVTHQTDSQTRFEEAYQKRS